MLSFGFRIFCWYRGFCHRTGSDLLLFLFAIGLMIDMASKKIFQAVLCPTEFFQ